MTDVIEFIKSESYFGDEMINMDIKFLNCFKTMIAIIFNNSIVPNKEYISYLI